MSDFPKIKDKKSIVWGIFSILIGIILSSSLYTIFIKITSGNTIPTDNLAAVIQVIPKEKTIDTGKYFYINKSDTDPKVSAKAYLVGDLNTGEVIISKNQNDKFPIASTSKIMTALVAEEIAKEDDIVKISKKALSTEGKNGNLRLGEKIKIKNLIYPLLLESSNDAAESIAEYYGRDSFMTKMNTLAEKLLMNSTNYKDPSGLSTDNQSTASDMFKLAGYINKNKPEIFKLTTKRSYSIKKHSWSNISQFLGENGYLGGKSGHTTAAKETVISLFNLPLGENGNRPIAITLLQSNDRQKDVKNIIRYLRKNIYYGGEADANTNWVTERVGLPDIREPDYINLAFAGDIMLDRGVKNSVLKNFNGDYSALFQNIDVFRKSDISFANLEGAVSDTGVDQKNLYSFRMDNSVIPALKGLGINIFSVANNHMADWGRIAFSDTLSNLKENEIFYTGGGNNTEEAETPVIMEKNGLKIGYLGFSDKGPDYMVADKEKAGVLLVNNPRFEEIIKNAAKQVDYLVISFHFGEEYQTKHNKRQEYLAHKAVDNGAKIVIGHHPHVVEDTEVYKNGYIAYSLGNFVFDQSWSKNTMQGMILEIKINKDGSMTVRKDPTQQNSVFQLEKTIRGKEDKIKFTSQ